MRKLIILIGMLCLLFAGCMSVPSSVSSQQDECERIAERDYNLSNAWCDPLYKQCDCSGYTCTDTSCVKDKRIRIYLKND